MSLLSLKKSTPSANPTVMSLDAFIEDALYYAKGHHHNTGSSSVVGIETRNRAENSVIKRHATFSLDEQTIAHLAALSQQTGISRSRLIRIWADQQSKRDIENLLCSDVA